MYIAAADARLFDLDDYIARLWGDCWYWSILEGDILDFLEDERWTLEMALLFKSKQIVFTGDKLTFAPSFLATPWGAIIPFTAIVIVFSLIVKIMKVRWED